MFKNLENWLWKKANRRPPKAYESYLQIVGVWIYIGLILGGMLALSAVIDETGSSLWYIPLIVGIALSTLLGIMAVARDKSEGYYKAIGETGKECWQVKAKSLRMSEDATNK